MTRLLKKRQAMRAQVTRLITEANKLLDATEEPEAGATDVMLERLQSAHQQLNEVDSEIEREEIELTDDDYIRICEYNDQVITCVARLKCRQREPERVAQRNEVTRQNGPNHMKVKLPKLELVKFDGRQRNWQSFWEQFSRLIHNNSELSQGDKFSYLKTTLTGDAAGAIAGLHASAECYKDAVDILQQRFGKDTAIIQHHMESLLDLRPVRSSDEVRELRRLYDRIQAHIRGLKALGVSEDSYCSLLYPVLLRSLPKDLVLQYNRSAASDDVKSSESMPSGQSGDSGQIPISEDGCIKKYRKEVSSLLKVLMIEVESRERTATIQNNSDDNANIKSRVKKSQRNDRASVSALQYPATQVKCVICASNEHATENCDADITLTKKKEILRSGRRCYRCTRPNHQSRNCRSKIGCKNCGRRHATTMCDPNYHSTEKKENDKPGEVGPVSLHSAINNTSRSTILLQTATAWVAGEKSTDKTRVLFDGGSQRSFITDELSRRLGCRLAGTEKLCVEGFGGVPLERTFKRVLVAIINLHGKKHVIEVLVTSKICDQILPGIDKGIEAELQHRGYLAADRSLNNSERIGLLIGAEHYWTLVTGKVHNLCRGLKAVETVLGWTVQGPIPSNGRVVHCNQVVVLRTAATEIDIEGLVTRLWELENIGILDTGVKELLTENEVVRSFEQSITKVNNRYVVRLPWKNEVELKDNEEIARRRLQQLMRKLGKNPTTMLAYDKVIRQHLEDGIAEVVDEPRTTTHDRTYYMPHQAVIRDNRTTTKLRVVFDASSHQADARSLNDNLESGPNLNPNLVALLLNFRRHKIALVADVEKAFLQIGIHEDDRDALRFLWFRETPTAELPQPETVVLRMTRVPFGTTASSFLLAATLHHHLRLNEQAYENTIAKIKDAIYVDDLLTGADTEESAEIIYREAKEVFAEASMNLHKWASNSAGMTHKFNLDVNGEKSLGKVEGVLKVLGLAWNPTNDCLTFTSDQVLQFASSRTDTKRFMLQTTARLYDPLGFLSPFLVKAKICFQRTWQRNLQWDDSLPNDLQQVWHDWCDGLRDLQDIRIPRFYFCGTSDSGDYNILHIFADASPVAYGAVAYLCIKDGTGETNSVLLISKSRVAPLKEMTLPRLELMAALVASRLYYFIKENMKLDLKEVHLWSDSLITLYWIKGDVQKWKQFVKNRVLEIQKNTEEHPWQHCPGTDNPADLLTRGVPARLLVECELWWKGPSWIRKEESEWPRETPSVNLSAEDLEQVSTSVLSTPVTSTPTLLEVSKFSSALRLHRTTAWIIRYVHNSRNVNKWDGPLRTEEIEKATEYWMRNVQQTAFQQEIAAVKNHSKLSTDSPLRDLSPFVDREGILRIGGRLQYSGGTYDERHPVVLPAKHHYCELLVRQTHVQLLHAGVRDTLIQLRERFWIVRARQLVKKVIHSCVTCRRLSAKPATQPAAPLPADRVTESGPFNVVGVDFAGPVLLKTAGRTGKSYITIFTCAVTRAIHLELAPDMSTKSFIQALRRFVSRRGLCRIIYSDNFRTFKRCRNELQELWRIIQDPEVANYFSTYCIKWKFIVERAPWWGGFYERLIRSVKTSLKKVLGRKLLGLEEMRTTLVEVEAVINSRPITFLYTDANEESPLSPSHFLVGKRLTSLPTPSTSELRDATQALLSNLWKDRQTHLDHFWRRWRKEYLGELRAAHASKSVESSTLNEGEVLMLSTT